MYAHVRYQIVVAVEEWCTYLHEARDIEDRIYMYHILHSFWKHFMC